MEDQKTVNLSADSTTPMDTDAASLTYAACSTFPRLKKKPIPDKQVYYMPKFTDPSAAFGSDDVESFFAQLDVKDESAKVFLALEGTEVVLCPDDDDLRNEELGNVSNLDEDVFTSSPQEPWSGVTRDTHPVTEICFPNDDIMSTEFDESGFSNSYDLMSLREEIFASFIDDEKCADSTSSLTKQQKLKNNASFQTKSIGDSSIDIPCQSSLTSSPKQTTAMLKRKSAFTGQDLLTQEAEVFSEFLEKSPDKPPSPISASRSKKIAESRLISALNAVDVSDDDDSLEPSELELHKFYSTAAAARNAAAEAAASLPAYSRTDASSATSDVFSRLNTQPDTTSAIEMTSRLSYDTGDLSNSNSYAASIPSAALRRIENDDLCMGFFFPTDGVDDDLSLRSDDLSDLSQFNNTPTEEAFVKLQRMARKGTSDLLRLLK